jgi:1-acyl-sn-glycerol-3-phosphate acyltransferase
MAVLPEGSVEGGRIDDNGNRKGMQKFRAQTCASAILLSKKIRRPGVAFVPVGIEGGWKINNPHGKFPTLEGWKAALLAKGDVCKITVGKPIRSDDADIVALIKERNWEELDNKIGSAVGRLISLNMRGVYA